MFNWVMNFIFYLYNKNSIVYINVNINNNKYNII